MAKNKKMKMKFNAIVTPLRKLLNKLEAYMIECAEAQTKNDMEIRELNIENAMINDESAKSATTARQLKVMLGDEVEDTDTAKDENPAVETVED